MRNIFAAPGWLIAYHKLLALFTIDMCRKINKLDRFLLKNLSHPPVCPYRNVQAIPGESEASPLSSMLVFHRPRTVAHDGRDIEKGATWTDWIPTSFGPPRLSRLSRVI